jgi:nanoRNase/pAp phosphatase (c-di-AMP/oligoRNAs hydrolase)
MMQQHLASLLKSAGSADRFLILTHSDPDPDAIASAWALGYLLRTKLGVAPRIVYKGIIGRAENRAMVHYLGCPLRHLLQSDLDRPVPVALVDTQPGAGNNALPLDHAVAIVLDHHRWREATAKSTFSDIRSDVGATSTILTEYLQAAGVELPGRLATALFYGIKTDTMGLSRSTHPADVAAYFALQPQVDIEALGKIERAQVPAAYYQSFVSALRATLMYDGVLVSYLGAMSYPDLAAEMADLLLRLEGTRWVACIGVYHDELILSVRRLISHGGGAEQVVQDVVGDRGTAGGHGSMAAGHIPLNGQEPEQLASELERLFLQRLDIAPGTVGQPLVE